MDSPETIQELEQCSHCALLDGDHIRTLCNAFTSLCRVLGKGSAYRTSVFTAILRLVNAHVKALPISYSITFGQVQAARLQLLADNLIFDCTLFPLELSAANAQDLFSSFDPSSNIRVPVERQRQQL